MDSLDKVILNHLKGKAERTNNIIKTDYYLISLLKNRKQIYKRYDDWLEQKKLINIRRQELDKISAEIERVKKEKQNTPTSWGTKGQRVSTWKNRGIIFHDWDLLYDIYTECKVCDYCKCDLKIGFTYQSSNTKCLDHDHSITDYDNVRGILCMQCNFKDVLSPLK